MSRIRRISYAISQDGRRATSLNQAQRIRESVLSLVEEANLNANSSRRITKKAAFSVILRSLQGTRHLPFSLREHMALKELSNYINLAKYNKPNALVYSHTDLLPISHPRSTREHSLTASALREARARWIVDDERITDTTAKTLLASALIAEVDSVEHTYYVSALSSLPQGTIPAETLIAAIGDGNSPYNRSLRAQLQRRDRKGRFAYQGGGIKALVRRAGKVFSLVGRTLMDTPDGKVLMELPDGRIAKITPEKGEYIKAVLNPTKDGFSPKPVRFSATDEIIEEDELEFVDAPEGWTKEGGYTWKNENWVVTKDDFGNFRASDGKGGNVEGKSWADILDGIDEVDKPSQKAVLPKKEEPATGKKSFEFEYPAGAFKLKVGQEYDPQGRQDEDAPRDFTDDPVELAQKFDPRDLVQALEEAVLPQGENENAFGYGNLSFEDGDGLVEADAIYNALKEAGEDADLELAKIYDKRNQNNNNEQALLDSRKGEEVVRTSEPDIAEAFERVTKEGTPDVAPAAEEPEFKEEKRDTTPLPPLLEGLNENELARFMESKDHTIHLPKNKDLDAPEGYNKLDPAPFQNWREVTADNPDPVLPEGFSDNPVFLAQNVSESDLKKELRRAVEPGNEAPGYGAVKLKTEDGEDFVANIPGEAVRDALQLLGVDTDDELNKIYMEGRPAQKQGIEDDEAGDILAQIEADDAAGVVEEEEEPSELSEKEKEVFDILKEEEDLADKYELEEDITRGDAQGLAMADMKKKYGKTATEALQELPRESAQRVLDENEKRLQKQIAERGAEEQPVSAEKKTIRPEIQEDFEVNAVEELPDGLAEYPKPANVAPAGDGGDGEGPKGPYRIVSKVTGLQPGDITVGDHFVITEIGEKVPGTDRVKIKGYYPGHVEQDTKQWNEWREIEVIRGAEAPAQGDLPVLSKPKEKDFGRRKKDADGNWGFANPEDQARFDAAMAEYNVQLDAAKKNFVDPTEPKNQPHRALVRAADVKPGDVTTDPKKGHFVIERTFTDENTKPGFVSVEGYYPGHVTQRKEWKVDTQIDVIRNAEAPAKGDLPELHQPHQVVDGKWRPDKDPAKRAEHQKMLDEAAARWQAPQDLPVIDYKAGAAEDDKDIPNAVAIARPTPPRMIEMPAFQGEMANIAREAGGDWNKFRELLADRDIVFFDFETTGVQLEDGNEPWQVAAVRMRNGEIIDRVNIFMNPGRSIKDTYAGRDTNGIPNAVDADGNKLTDEFLAQQPNQEEAMKQLLEWAGPNAIFGAQNMVFDEEVARRMADKYGLDWAPTGLLDVLPMARDIYKDQPKENRPKTPKGRESYALGNLAKHLGVDLENWHAADADAEAAAKIFNALIEKGIEFDAGKDLFDVDARNDEYVAKMDDYNAALADYDVKLGEYVAAKAINDALAGKPVNIDDVVKAATPNKAEGQEVDAGPVGLEPEPVRINPEPVVLDFTPNADFPRGKMIMKDRDWVLDDGNTALLPRENIRMRDLLPGDFMQSKDGNTIWQVVAIRAGEEFGLKPGRVKVYRRNIENGEISTYEHWHGVFLDGVRRPINPRDLDAPETVVEGEKAPFIANEPENAADIEEKSVAGDVVYRKTVDIGGLADGYIRIRKNKEGRYEVIVGIVDNNDEAVLSFNNDYRTYDGAVAEAEAVLKERADEFLAERRAAMPEPEEARAKNVPVSRGDVPGDAQNAPEFIEVENLPNDIVGDVKIQDVGEDKPDFQADAVVKDAEGEVIANQTTNHGNKNAAEKEGRDFVNRVVDAIQNPEKPAEEKPKRERAKKALTEEQIRAAEEQEAKDKDNAWVEANAGRLAPIEAQEVNAGDFFWEPFWGNFAEVLEAKYIGYLDRYEFKVQNRVNGKIETRYFKADSPLRNVRRPGVADEEFEIPQEKGTNRGAKRGLIKRKALDERIVAKEGRAMGGRFEKEGYFKDANGVPLQPGDVVMHPRFGRGVVKKREGAQVEEGKKAGGVVRGKKVYLDNLMVQFENEDAKWVLNQGGRLVKARKLERLNEIDAPITLPDFRGGRKAPNLVPGKAAPKPPLPRADAEEDKNAEAEANKAAEELKNFVAPDFGALDNQQIADGLNYINEQLEIAKNWYKSKKRDKATTVGNAQRAINNLLNDFDVANPEKINLDELDAAIRRVNRTSDLEEIRQSLAELRDRLAAEKSRLEVEKEKNLVADLNNPFGELPNVDTVEVDNFKAALDEIIGRLPRQGRSEAIRNLAYAKDYLKEFADSISTKDDLVEGARTDYFEEAIKYISRVKGLDVSALSTRLDDINKLLKEFRKKNQKPFAKANMPFIDPVELREKRIADGANKFNLAQAPNLKGEFANDKVFEDNVFLQPYKDEIQQFFAKDGEVSIAELNKDARQALAQYVRTMFSGKGPTNVDEKKARALELATFMRGLHEERVAFEPNREDLGIGDMLKNIDPNAVFSAGQNLNNRKAVDLVINGQDTGFRIQKVGDGINASYNYRLIHKESGQIFYFKRERGLEEADAELASSQLARALGIIGAPVVVRHDNDAQVLIMTNAGDSVDFEAKPKVVGNAVNDRADLARRAAIIDLIGLGVLDAIIYNSDRHQNNMLFAPNDRGVVGGNGYEEIQILPIDHGFAQAFLKKNRAVVGNDPEDWFTSGNERDGGKIVKELAKEIGAVNFKELTDMTIQQAIQAIERGDYFADINPDHKKKVIDRLLALKGIDADKWRLAIAKKL